MLGTAGANGEFAQKKKKKKRDIQLLFKEFSCPLAGSVKREEEVHDMLQIRVSHGLIKVGQQGLRRVAVPERLNLMRGKNFLEGTLHMHSAQASKEGEGVPIAATWCTSWTNQRVAQ